MKLNNNPSDGLQRLAMLVSSTVEEEDTEPVNLFASFSSSENSSYQYEMKDLDAALNKPPALVKITRVPTNGNIVIK